MQIVKTQYGIVIHEVLRTLEVALLPTSRSARQALLVWLTCNNNNKTAKCPAKSANTCSVTKLYLASTGTRGSAVKKISKRLRSPLGNNKSHLDVMCSYVGEVASNVIDKLQADDDSKDEIFHQNL